MDINFYHSDGYKKDKQFIIGITFNKELIAKRTEPIQVIKKYEINFWVGYHGFHIEIQK